MSNPNQAYGNNFDSDNSVWDEGNGYKGSSGYGYDNDLVQQQSPLGGDTAYTTDWITNLYVENPYEVNFFDNAYSETLSNPNLSHDYSDRRANNTGFELE